MKKKSLAALAMMTASLGMASVPNVSTVQTGQSKTIRVNDAVEKIPQTVRQGKPTALNPSGGGSFTYIDAGLSPKEYGQFLQRTGRQKWIKRMR